MAMSHAKPISHSSLHSNFLPPKPLKKALNLRTLQPITISISCSSSSPSSPIKIIRNPRLDKQVTKQNKLRFIQKLQTLILSKPKHFIPIRTLSKCRSYLAIPPPKSLVSMIYRYPSIFTLFTIPCRSPLSPNRSQHCVKLTPEASSLAQQKSILQASISECLATKLQKLLMLSSHHRLLLSKLVHLGPDLGLPANFRSRLCNDHPEKFKIVETSYGRALELVNWDPDLAIPLKPLGNGCGSSMDLIVERPELKFKQVRLRKGLNLKRKHKEFLIKFQELPEISPYNEEVGGGFAVLRPETIEAEKRSCGVVREVLGMMVEKRTLVDHLTHFRKEFGLPNKLRGMIVRHPELFYVSLKGERDSVFLVEGYDERGELVVEKDDDGFLEVKERLVDLVRKSKIMRRQRRESGGGGVIGGSSIVGADSENSLDDDDDDVDDEKDGFEDLFVGDDEWEDYGDGDDDDVDGDDEGDNGESFDVVNGQFWSIEKISVNGDGEDGGTKSLEHW